jgi:uncharacterized protein YeaO (DUF488 family)
MSGGVGIKRVYDPASKADGTRVLIDRLWPRGLTKEAAAVDVWLKDVAPSHELRRWFDHDPAKWEVFQQRYRAELDRVPDAVAELRALVRAQRVTLVFGSKEATLNNARALLAMLDGSLKPTVEGKQPSPGAPRRSAGKMGPRPPRVSAAAARSSRPRC